MSEAVGIFQITQGQIGTNVRYIVFDIYYDRTIGKKYLEDYRTLDDEIGHF